MAVTCYSFRLLSPLVQLYGIFQSGTFLANRWEQDGAVNLYRLADEGRSFFMEVGH